MHLSVRKAAEPVIARADTIVFHHGKRAVDVATAKVGGFDSTPYERREDQWSFHAELHQHDGRLWIRLVDYDVTILLVDGEWVYQSKEKLRVYVSDDEGETWTVVPSPSNLRLDEATQLHRIDSVW